MELNRIVAIGIPQRMLTITIPIGSNVPGEKEFAIFLLKKIIKIIKIPDIILTNITYTVII